MKFFFSGYDPNVKAGIASSFSTAAYRFGHSLLIPKFNRLDKDFKKLSSINLSQVRIFVIMCRFDLL